MELIVAATMARIIPGRWDRQGAVPHACRMGVLLVWLDALPSPLLKNIALSCSWSIQMGPTHSCRLITVTFCSATQVITGNSREGESYV